MWGWVSRVALAWPLMAFLGAQPRRAQVIGIEISWPHSITPTVRESDAEVWSSRAARHHPRQFAVVQRFVAEDWCGGQIKGGAPLSFPCRTSRTPHDP